MKSREFWDEFADATIKRLIEPDAGDPVLILADAQQRSESGACVEGGRRAFGCRHTAHRQTPRQKG